MSEQIPLRIRKGKTFRKVFYLCSTSFNDELYPVDLTNYTIRGYIREFQDDTSPILTLTNGSGITLTKLENAETIKDNNGDVIIIPIGAYKVSVYISDESTAAISIDRGVWDAELVSPGGDVYSIFDVSTVIVADDDSTGHVIVIQ